MTFREAIAAFGMALVLCVAHTANGQDTRPSQSAGRAAPQTAAVAAVTAMEPEPDSDCAQYAHGDAVDPTRVVAVQQFLNRHHCPIEDLAPEFVRASTLNGLDYRLLPTLAVLESGCGRATRNHNLFGWANGRMAFASFAQAIHHVAQRLRLAPHYAGKSTLQKLRMYNRRGAYRAKVLRMMESLGQPEQASP